MYTYVYLYIYIGLRVEGLCRKCVELAVQLHKSQDFGRGMNTDNHTCSSNPAACATSAAYACVASARALGAKCNPAIRPNSESGTSKVVWQHAACWQHEF